MREMKRTLMCAVLVAGLLVGDRAHGLVTSGMLLTNFAPATFALPSGGAGGAVPGGINAINVPNSQTAWVLVTDTPQLCMVLWKSGTTIDGTTLTGSQSGTLVCFTISFSNCGNYTGFNVNVTDTVPCNTVKSGVFIPGAVWVSGGTSVDAYWATSLSGPWNTTTSAGQTCPLYLRWVLSKVGLHQTGYIRYCVTIL